MSFEGGYQSDASTTQTLTKGGAVFITDIEAQEETENVASKLFTSDGLVLQSCSSSTDLIRVSVLAITGFSAFKPVVMVENQLVNLIQDEDQNVWKGTIDIDLNQKTFIEAVHNDGAFHRCMLISESKPIVSNAFLKGGYPENQTELKENDSFALQVEGSEAFTKVEIDNYGSAKGQIYTVSEGITTSINLTIANKGNLATIHGVRLRIENGNGTKSDWFETTINGLNDGVHTVILNNLKPSIVLQEIIYPENQSALKNTEQAIVKHEISNFDSVLYSSPNGQLTINEENQYLSSKVVSRIEGSYNETVHNLQIVAKRTANGATESANLVVKIAHEPVIISFEGNEKRLVSGGNNETNIQVHQLFLQANQGLISVPQLSVEHGTLIGVATQVQNSYNYEQSIRIHDTDQKGTHRILMTKAVNLAGIETNSFVEIEQYTIGGFVQRTLTFQEFSNEVFIGTQVSDVLKLSVTDKDGIIMNYTPNLENSRLSFSITQPTDIVNPIGNIFHWNDEQAVNNNSTGLATVSIEELP